MQLLNSFLIFMFLSTTAISGELIDKQFSSLNTNLSGSLQFEINPENAKTLIGITEYPLYYEDIAPIVGAACGDWNVCYSYTGVLFTVGGETDREDAADGHSVILFAPMDLKYGGCSVIKATQNGVITECDITLNSNYFYMATTGDSVPGNLWDLWSILVHEMGHSLGLGHCDDSYVYNTMYKQIYGGKGSIETRGITQNDLVGAIYQGIRSVGGALPFSQCWKSGSATLSLSSNVTISSNDTLEIDINNSTGTINLNGYDIINNGGLLNYISGKISPHIAVKNISNGAYKGFYHTLSGAASVLTGNEYIEINSIVDIDDTVTLPQDLEIEFGDNGRIIVDGGTLNISSGVVLTKIDAYANWFGITVEADGEMNVNGSITVEDAVRIIIKSDDVTFSNNTSYFNDCGGIWVKDSSPFIRKIQMNSCGNATNDAVYVSGASCPDLYNLTLDDDSYGLEISGSTSDAILKYSIIQSDVDDCINLSTTAGLDMVSADCDIYPNYPSYYAIDNTGSTVTNNVLFNYWSSSDSATVRSYFSDPTKLYWWPIDSSANGYGASKIARPQEPNPLHVATDLELAGDYESAYDVYLDILADSYSDVQRRMAVKKLLRLFGKAGMNYNGLRDIVSDEMPGADGYYREFLDYMTGEIYIREGDYHAAIQRFTTLAPNYAGSPMEVEMYARVANIYGDFLDDKAAALEYANLCMELNPGQAIVESAFESAGLEYNASEYADKYATPLPEEPIKDNQVSEDIDISVNPNPFNPTTVISYTLPADANVRLSIYTITGQKIDTLVDSHQQAGNHTVTFNGRDLASGIYFYRFETQNQVKTGRLLLVK